MHVRQFAVEGLGHLSTLIADDETGLAAVVDPRRDVDVYLDAARDADLRISHVLETHLHNDYVSGGRELAALTGATHVIGAGADLQYAHRPVRHGDDIVLGSLRITVLETPGHTPEHVAYAIADTSRAEERMLLLTGGSLLVGAVGRTDLLGAEHAVPYAHAMHRSLRDVVLPHEDFVTVLPTHGAGSLCSTGIAATPSSTIGFERRYNPMLRPIVDGDDVERFVQTLLADQPTFPRYFARMRPTNQAGPRLIGARVPEPTPLDLEEVRAVVARGGLVVDLRTPPEFAAAHIPGSLSLPAGSSFGTWLGWLVEPDQPIVLVLRDDRDWEDAIRQALRIGHEEVRGHLRGGFAAWAGSGAAIETHGSTTVHDLAAAIGRGADDTPIVIDVRQATEYAEAHVPGAVHIAGGDLAARLAELPHDRPIVTMCASGYRASVAASVLGRGGFRNVTWVADGVPAWQAAGLPVERGIDDDAPQPAAPVVAHVRREP
ncbi:MAG: rhodanese-like domain-containing protein [Chloroflexota bacterium]